MAKKQEDLSAKLAEFEKALEKEFGKGTIVNLNERETYKDIIQTSSFSLNMASGINGFAKGKLYEIFADPSSGKSTLSYDIIANCQKQYNEYCCIIEKEDSYGSKYGEGLGIDNSLLKIYTPDYQEDMYDLLINCLKSNMFGTIVVDSLTSFAPKARFEGSQIMGIESRINSNKLREVIHFLQKTNTCLIILNQTRQKIGAMGDPTTTSGGTALSFYAHVRIKITRSEINKELRQNTMKFHFIKNKLAPPFKIGSIAYKWEGGFDKISEYADIALESGIIKLEGRSYYLPDGNGGFLEKMVGKKTYTEYMEENPEYLTKVIHPLVINYLNNKEVVADENE